MRRSAFLKKDMKIFSSEDELLSVLEKHDQLILDCVSERIEFDKFLQDYDNFYMSYALDGHESDEEEKKMFEHYKNKIEPHKKVWELILAGGLASEENAAMEEYKEAGRFGSAEALNRLKSIARKYFSFSFIDNDID
jgi:hypothetical protein